MDGELNVTYITLGGHVKVEEYGYVYFFIMFTVYVLIICSNSIIVYIIWIHKNLHEPMYVFIAALSLNSLLFSAGIYPKLLIDFLSEKQVIAYSACLFQFFLFYTLGGSDSLLLAAMAYDRYVSICKPLRYPTIMRKSTVCMFLSLAWLLPPAEVAVAVVLSANRKLCSFTLTGIFCNNSVYKLQCVASKTISIYGLIVMLNLTLLPMFFILFTYAKIFMITYQSGREVRKKATETCLPHLLVLFAFSCLIAYDVIIARLKFNFSKTVRLIMTLQVVLYSPLFNPIIYGLKMKEITKHLKSLFFQGKCI
ncbi:olfactory receptor 6N2-like [Sphaeramia orbicularis]|uniref:Olfactory receptor n=1 Tax=Sphaeramia orbicularis TaxID=375764 RepID=A0A673BGF3_9TELE|nr:olfactory receptor 6N2-like [Sphaeramia orbicularis]